MSPKFQRLKLSRHRLSAGQNAPLCWDPLGGDKKKGKKKKFAGSCTDLDQSQPGEGAGGREGSEPSREERGAAEEKAEEAGDRRGLCLAAACGRLISSPGLPLHSDASAVAFSFF